MTGDFERNAVAAPCPMCGGPVLVVTGREGTEPVDSREQLAQRDAAIRAAIYELETNTWSGWERALEILSAALRGGEPS